MDLIEAFEVYPDVAKPIIIKSDVLRLGLWFTETALDSISKIKGVRLKQYDMFRYDTSEDAMSSVRAPDFIFLEDGTEDGTLIQVRVSRKSPYLVDFVDGVYELSWNGEKLAKILRFNEMNKFTELFFSDGTPYSAYAWTMGDDMLHIPALRHCEHFSMDQQCLFCDFTPTSVKWKKQGGAVVVRKDAEKAAIVFDVAMRDKRHRHASITGGTILTQSQGMSDLEWYLNFLTTIKKRIYTWPPTLFQIAALDDEGWKRIHDTGVTNIQPNIEVWDKKLFEIVCPGKAKVVGYDEWIKRTINAAKYWGGGSTNPSFVLGVEMARPFGFERWEDAVKSTLSGYDFLMSNGVLPRQGDFWCLEPDSKLAKMAEQPIIPLEYYIEIGKGYLELYNKYGFTVPTPVHCRHCQCISTDFEWEYFHGHGPASKEGIEKASKKPE